jgi:hypothetical protein
MVPDEGLKVHNVGQGADFRGIQHGEHGVFLDD